MKMITVVLRPEQLPAVKKALFDADMRHMTATPVLGTAPETEQQLFRGVRREVELCKRVRMEVAVKDTKLTSTIEAISKGAKESGGFGKIFVTEISDVVTIWTGDRGDDAL
jgi:nitrogen regulatory protein P-II 1